MRLFEALVVQCRCQFHSKASQIHRHILLTYHKCVELRRLTSFSNFKGLHSGLLVNPSYSLLALKTLPLPYQLDQGFALSLEDWLDVPGKQIFYLVWSCPRTICILSVLKSSVCCLSSQSISIQASDIQSSRTTHPSTISIHEFCV